MTAQYIKHTLKYTGKVYIVGPRGLAQELDAVGIPNFGAGVRMHLICFSLPSSLDCGGHRGATSAVITSFAGGGGGDGLELYSFI